MAVVALIMAGGRGTRMGSIEKPVVSIDGKTMLERVTEALKGAAGVEEIYVATSPYTIQTEKLARDLGLKVIRTSGRDYVMDAQQAIRTLLPRTALVISADLPLVSSRLIEKIIRRYFECAKPSLKVVMSTSGDDREAKDLLHSTEQKESVRPVGINIIDSRHIDESLIDEAVLLVDSDEVAVNVNTPEDLKKVSFKKPTYRIDELVDSGGSGSMPR